MKVSIIVPIYRVEKEIIRCLHSIVGQSYPNIELIIINDCSPDHSFEVARTYLENIETTINISYIDLDKNVGVSVARNKGIESATGNYLFFMDSDDEFSSRSSLEILVGIVKKYQYPDIVIGSYQYIDDSTVIQSHTLSDIFYSNEGIFYKRYCGQGIYWAPWGKLIKRELIEKNNLRFYPRLYSEDILWSFNLFRVAKNAYLSSEIIYNYYHRSGSIMSSLTEKHLDDLGFILQEMYQDYLNNKYFYPQETITLIERYRRMYLKYLFLLKGKDRQYRCQKLKKLQEIKLPLLIDNFKYFRQNLLLRLPNIYIELYLRLKWSSKKYNH